MTFSITPSRAGKALGGLIGFLALCSLMGQISKYFLGHGRLLGFVHQFYLGGEGNISTYFATLFLLSAALLLAVIARHAYESMEPYRRHWAILALIFAYLSIDEFAMLHEHLGTLTEEYLLAGEFFTYAWIIPASGLLVLFGIGYLRFFLHLSSRWQVLFATSAVIYVGGAIGLEMIGGWFLIDTARHPFSYQLVVTVEEVMEKAGAALFIYSLLEYIRVHNIEVVLTLEDERAPVSSA